MTTPHIGCFEPTKKALKKSNRETYTRVIEAANKKLAAAMLTTQFYIDHADIADDYFDVKICDDSVELSRPGLDQWSTNFCWNKERGEIELIEKLPDTDNDKAPEFINAAKLPGNYRAALLALFGRVDNITKIEYGQALDLANDSEPSFARELGEAITRTPRVLALPPERQAELLAYVREVANETAQWTELKKLMDKWLDTPDKRMPSGAAAGDQSVAAPAYVELTFEQRIAVAINAPTVQLDEVTPEILADAMNKRKCEYPAFIRARKALTYIQPTLEKFSDRVLGEAVRSVDFNEEKGIVAYRRAVLDFLGINDEMEEEDETEQGNQSDAVGQGNDSAADEGAAPGRTVFSLDELTAGPDKATPAPVSDREIEICIAINDVLSGAGDIMSAEDTEELLAAAGHKIADMVGMLTGDFIVVEPLHSPSLSDSEIYNLTLDALEKWTDDAEGRRSQISADIADWREFEAKIKRDRLAEPVEEFEALSVDDEEPAPLNYHQLLTIAAVQGLCANSAHATTFDDIAFKACTVASTVLRIQEDK